MPNLCINDNYVAIWVSWIFIVAVHWNNSLWVDMALHLSTLSWFWAKQSLLLLLNAVCLPEAAANWNTNFIVTTQAPTGNLPH